MGSRLSPSLLTSVQPSPPEASCTIIVTDANALAGKIHNRMPAVLDDADVGRWALGIGRCHNRLTGADDRGVKEVRVIDAGNFYSCADLDNSGGRSRPKQHRPDRCRALPVLFQGFPMSSRSFPAVPGIVDCTASAACPTPRWLPSTDTELSAFLRKTHTNESPLESN
jgi:hypothetical protein